MRGIYHVVYNTEIINLIRSPLSSYFMPLKCCIYIVPGIFKPNASVFVALAYQILESVCQTQQLFFARLPDNSHNGVCTSVVGGILVSEMLLYWVRIYNDLEGMCLPVTLQHFLTFKYLSHSRWE